ncbi:serine hydrolase [Brevibacillus sp. MS2.2]|uniref:serine hydrolase domain-containing protein n=1 Tax=Brevibacillus sp. MS2.2 TaxID=2738981 RepID=UPI00156A95C1|nr:serine hydrolase domain-containing protein [Brevibacillus sp. MS2.2]NRR24592.1 beta-lactamase family protein [Brevibacillus sp. MS2.2]
MNKISMLTVSTMITATLLLPLQGTGFAKQADPLVTTYSQDSQTKAKQLIDEAANHQNIPGIIVASSNKGSKWAYASGEASIYGTDPVKTNFTFRIGSLTKTFTAMVVLQLVDEQKLNLDDTIEKWLPDVVKGTEYEGDHITIRQLLNQTSGIPDYSEHKDILDKLLPNPLHSFTADELVRTGLNMKATSKPGEKWVYSNTNTVLAGMIIKKATGETYGEHIRKRFIAPLKLTSTYVPDDYSFIPGEHAQGYFVLDGQFIDRTEMNPSWADAAGSMISTADDMNTFFSAILSGKLLKPATLDQMLTGVETPVGEYGLGIVGTKLTNGITIWGHGGNFPGFATFAGGTRGGDYVQTLNINAMPSEINTLTLSKSIAEQLIGSSSH